MIYAQIGTLSMTSSSVTFLTLGKNKSLKCEIYINHSPFRLVAHRLGVMPSPRRTLHVPTRSVRSWHLMNRVGCCICWGAVSCAPHAPSLRDEPHAPWHFVQWCLCFSLSTASNDSPSFIIHSFSVQSGL